MELQEIEIFIGRDGQVRLGVHGVRGMACLDITAAVEKALGGQVELRELTPEAYESAADHDQNWLQQRDA